MTKVSAQQRRTEGLMRVINQLRGRVQELERTASTDELTHLLNKRGVKEAYLDSLAHNIATYMVGDSTERQDERRTSQAQYISFVLHDIDDFKDTNDSFSHDDGDIILEEVAEREMRTLRGTDSILARLGGEEFGIILPRTNSTGAQSVAEKVRRVVEEEPFRIEPDGRQIDLKQTISVGTATYDLHGIEERLGLKVGEEFEGTVVREGDLNDHGTIYSMIRESEVFKEVATEIWSDLMRKADGALYVAKLLGKNQSKTYNDDVGEVLKQRDMLRALYATLCLEDEAKRREKEVVIPTVIQNGPESISIYNPLKEDEMFQQIPPETQAAVTVDLRSLNRRKRHRSEYRNRREVTAAADELYRHIVIDQKDGEGLGKLFRFAQTYLNVNS